MKIDRDQVRMVMALFVVAIIAAAVTGLTDLFTRGPIATAEKQALHKALQQVLPAHTNDPQAAMITLLDTSIYPAKNSEGELTGLAWEVVAPDGYSGSIRILVGIRPAGAVHAIRITYHRETPGLGDGIIKDHSWLAGFVGQELNSKTWKVKKDGGDFDQFTGATITPRAVVKAVKHALEFFHDHHDAILEQVMKQQNSASKQKEVSVE